MKAMEHYFHVILLIMLYFGAVSTVRFLIFKHEISIFNFEKFKPLFSTTRQVVLSHNSFFTVAGCTR